MSSRLSALLIWGLVAASAVFWALRFTASSSPVPVGADLAGASAQVGGDLSRLLGTSAVTAAATPEAAPAEASRFRLTGIVATTNSRKQGRTDLPGVALISVDGAPPRAYRVGEPVDSRLALLSVALRSASLGDSAANGTVSFVLELAPPSPPATGNLSSTSSLPSALPQAARVPPMQAPPAPPMQSPLPIQQSPAQAEMAQGQAMPIPQPGNAPAMQKLRPGVAPGFQVQMPPPAGDLPGDGVLQLNTTGQATSRTMQQ